MIKKYIQSLKTTKLLADQIVYHTVLPEIPACWSQSQKHFSADIKAILNVLGIDRLYRHQSESLDWIRTGQHTVVATPTASGKTLIYNLPLLDKFQANAVVRALYIFPLKALAQDQLRIFKELAAHFKDLQPTAAIYDGDTTAWHRKRIREAPPNVLLTNPEMLHLSFLPHHQKWAVFFSGLELVVFDEVHTYRGVFGTHIAQVVRRLQRIFSFYRVSPIFVFSSATLANPAQLVKQLSGLDVIPVTVSGAPQGKQHVILVDPIKGPAHTAILLLKAALQRGLRTIVYTQSRKLAELISVWAQKSASPYASRISAYRAGFLPEERRKIETRLATGDLLAVISTSALELGIDIGDLDLCILVGYPGSVVATLQRSGRVGRSGQDSATILVAGEDALDQYFLRNPLEFVHKKPEAAVVNPFNPEILAKQLRCAAAELPLSKDEPLMSHQGVKQIVSDLEQKGELLRSADGKEFYCRQKMPHRHIDLRGTGNRFHIVSGDTDRRIGEIDGFRAFTETHPGAVYLHQGKTFLVKELNLATETVMVAEAHVNFYTRVRAHKETAVLEVYEKKLAWGTRVFTGRLQVTSQVTGYEKWNIHTKERISHISLELPPSIFETEGLWFKITNDIQQATDSKYLDFLGGLHAFEHAAIGIFPLLVMSDRNDLGGFSTLYHPHPGSAAVFIFDSIPGGAGLSLQAFNNAENLLEYTLKVIRDCPCESGCPSCVHSPKCGSGNRPIDKPAAIFILQRLNSVKKTDKTNQVNFALGSGQSLPETATPGAFKKTGDYLQQRRNSGATAMMVSVKKSGYQIIKQEIDQSQKKVGATVHFGVFDLETQRSAQEVGGWQRADLMGISCVVLYDSKEDDFFEFTESQIDSLVDHLKKFDRIVGFNIKRFDYKVLEGYSDFDFKGLPALDILEEIYLHLGYRLSLDHLATVTLNRKKSADGLQALKWWKQGRLREIMDYCRQDVEITKDLYLFGKNQGYLLFINRGDRKTRIPVDW
jgi:DEAD/DEAH box helicase domain-containing protein